MTPEEFTSASIALLRSVIGWQSAIARRLDVQPRQVRRWLHDRSIPLWVGPRMTELMGGIEPNAWPRDEWVIGDGVTADGHAREYIVHLAAPRFSARIVIIDEVTGLPEPDEEPADILSGVVYTFSECVLCEIDWIDQPSPGEVTQLMEAACNAIDEMNARIRA